MNLLKFVFLTSLFFVGALFQTPDSPDLKEATTLTENVLKLAREGNGEAKPRRTSDGKAEANDF